MKRSLVIIPSYNEKENIADIIAAVLSQGSHFDVLVVDDNSPDGTADIVKELRVTNDKIFLIERSGKLGLGTAYLCGFEYGLAHNYDYIFEMDADFSHDPKVLNKMLDAFKEKNVDLVVGSRYIEGGGIADWPIDRKILSYGASIYVRIIARMPVKDPTAGFICYSRQVLEGLDLAKIKLKGYGFQIEMKYAAFCNDFNIKEIPIIFKDREKGQSKMNGNIIMEAILGVLNMKIKSFSGYYKKNQPNTV